MAWLVFFWLKSVVSLFLSCLYYIRFSQFCFSLLVDFAIPYVSTSCAAASVMAPIKQNVQSLWLIPIDNKAMPMADTIMFNINAKVFSPHA